MKSAIAFSNPNSVHAPLGRYSHGALVRAATDLLFISGQVGVKPDGSTAGGLSEQTEQAFANLFAVLSAHGLGAADIVKLAIFVVIGQDMAKTRDVRETYFGEHRPASTAIYVAQLASPEWLIEVEAIAARS